MDKPNFTKITSNHDITYKQVGVTADTRSCFTMSRTATLNYFSAQTEPIPTILVLNCRK